VEHFILIGRDDGFATVESPGFDECIGELATDLHEEGPGADGGVADLEVENLCRERVFAKIGEDGFEGFPDDGFGEFPRCVMGARLTAGVGGLEED
jgi:hypothetical protein